MPGTELPDPIQRRHRRLAAALAVLAAFALLGPVFSQAAFTASTSNSGRIGAAKDWAGPMVEIIDPGDAIRGTVTITAAASDDGLGIASVSLAWAVSESTTFTPLCSASVAPYSCSFNTLPIGEGEVDLRAVAVDRAGFVSTALLEGVIVDNVAPTGSLGSVPPLSGVVTIPATAADTTSGVASVAIQRAASGTTAWTTICTDLEAPYSCRFDTTPFPSLVTYLDFRAVITDQAGNTTTTASVRNRQVSNLTDSVSIEDPGPFLRGTATINANAAATLGVASVRIQRQAIGGTWVDICSDAATPYSCAWNTTTVADGQYNLRAILTNSLMLTTTSAIVGPVWVDNTPVRGHDVQGGPVTGTANRIGAGDSLNFTYSRPMLASSIHSGWTGTTAVNVVVRLRDGGSLGLTGSDDTIDVFTTTSYATPVNLGTVNMKGNYVKNKKTAAFNATMTMESVTVNGVAASRVTLTITGVAAGASRTAGGNPTMVWTPSATARDTSGIATSTAPVVELGPADRDV